MLYPTILICLNAFTLSQARYLGFFGAGVGGSTDQAMSYLSNYGYTEKDAKMTDSIKMFQMFCHLPQTGQIDNDTMAKMKMPRCGNGEEMRILKNSDIQMKKSAMVAKWSRSDLTYSIKNLPRSGIEAEILTERIRAAFDMWQNVSKLTFTQLQDASDPDIKILFVTNDQDNGLDNRTFGSSGIGRSIAHAFYPQGFPEKHDLEGEIHFDNDRGWTVDTEDGLNFVQVCVHEIGHAIGLRHSMEEESVMYMLAKDKYDPNFHLHEDDIRGIQNLYGAPTTELNSPHPVVSNSHRLDNYNYDYTSEFDNEFPLSPEPLTSNNLNEAENPTTSVLPISHNFLPYLAYCNQFQILKYYEEAQNCFNNLARHTQGLYSKS